MKSRTVSIWLFNIAMENGPFVDGLPGFTCKKGWFSMAMLCIQASLQAAFHALKTRCSIASVFSAFNGHESKLHAILYNNVYIYIYIWVNYNNSLTFNKAIWGWFPLLTMIPVRSQWGRYNLPIYIYIYTMDSGIFRVIHLYKATCRNEQGGRLGHCGISIPCIGIYQNTITCNGTCIMIY